MYRHIETYRGFVYPAGDHKGGDRGTRCPPEHREQDDDEDQPVDGVAPSTPPSIANAASRIGTAPFSPLQAMKARSPRDRRARRA